VTRLALRAISGSAATPEPSGPALSQRGKRDSDPHPRPAAPPRAKQQSGTRVPGYCWQGVFVVAFRDLTRRSEPTTRRLSSSPAASERRWPAGTSREPAPRESTYERW